MSTSFPAEQHHCPVCALDYPSLTVAWAVQRIAEGPHAVASHIAGIPEHLLRRRPGTGWSIVEYACHLRDVYATYTIRLYRARTEDRPALEPMFNDLRAARFRYNESPVEPVLAQLAANGHGLREEIAALSEADLLRTVTRRPTELRSVLWLVRQAAHETVHHIDDMGRLLKDP